MNTIEGINHHLIIIGTVGYQIPTLLKDFQAIGLDFESVSFIAPITLITHFEHRIFLECLNDSWQKLFTFGYLFKQNLIFDANILHHQIANGQCIEQPTTQAAAFQFVSVLDVITVLTALLIFNDKAKHFFDGNAPFVESP